ncbi:MAG: hypothetical protein NC908_00370 [Candidatus Omnitrophica bacterium]|nr:hypothetical protein [Candidatus Omnitrophota bacterium]
MRRYITLAIWLVFIITLNCFAEDLVWRQISQELTDISAVTLHPDNPDIIYVGSSRGVFKTEDAGQTWRNILFSQGKVNFLLFDRDEGNSIYAATEKGLYFSDDQGRHWRRVFKGKNRLEDNCISIAVLPHQIYLGTRAGLFLSKEIKKDDGRNWYKDPGILADIPVLAIAYRLEGSGSAQIYLANTEGVFRAKAGLWDKIFTAHLSEDDKDKFLLEDTLEDHPDSASCSDLRYISIDPHNSGVLYLSTQKGVYKTEDDGKTWKPLSSQGLLSRDVRFLFVSSKRNLYAATESGIFRFDEEELRWQELSLRLMVKKINGLALDNQDNLYAATDKGLFKANLALLSQDDKYDVLAPYIKGEPGIREVHQAAIEYAEVSPEKIKQWRRQAAKRALLPRLSIDMDYDKNKTISNSIWGTYGTNCNPGKYFVGPDDTTNYRNRNWSISLTWELGDLIWSDDQTNIDVRSRLMVQLRDDILDEVTKIYFERLRIKMELLNLPFQDKNKRCEKELKIQELTAMLDALTGGYFSRQLQLEPNLNPKY